MNTVLGSDLSSIQCVLSRQRSGSAQVRPLESLITFDGMLIDVGYTALDRRSDMSFWPCVLWLCDEGVGKPSG
jgi:hypothetical protein